MVPLNEFNPDSSSQQEVGNAAIYFGIMATYCHSKFLAIDMRAKDNIREAWELEALCQRLYNTLPDSWRW
jgi:hypothetical protein